METNNNVKVKKMTLFAHRSGVYENMPADEYHSDPAIGSSTLKTLIKKSALHAHLGSGGPSKNVGDFGEAFHMAILEPSRFEIDVICGPEDRRGNKWKDALEEAGSKTLITSGDYSLCKNAQDSLMKSETIRNLVTSKCATPESSIFWTDEETGLRCKCRPDLRVRKQIVDLKTVASISHFDKDAYKFGYQIQQAHYVEGCDNQLDGGHSFLFLAVEKEEPFGFSIFEYDARSADRAKEMWRSALTKWNECVKSNSFPSYPEYQVMSLPDYAFPSMFEE